MRISPKRPQCKICLMQENIGDLRKAVLNTFYYRANYNKNFLLLCIYILVPENIHSPPTEGIGNSREAGGPKRPPNLKQCMYTCQVFVSQMPEIFVSTIPKFPNNFRQRPNIPDDVPTTSEHCRRSPKMFR